MNDIFFVHPGENNEVKKMILNDINKAKTQILCAMAFFTDEDISKTLMESKVKDKRIILNNADFAREDSKVARKLFNTLDCMRLGTYYEGDKSGSHMHNKILICDTILWIGSYNFTNQASKRNWENMLRIEQEDIVKKTIYEFESMWFYSLVIKDKLKGSYCKECGKIVDDPMKHYAVFINTSFIVNGFWDDDAISTLCLDVHDKEERLEKCVECGKFVSSSEIIVIDDSSSCEGICRKCAMENVKYWRIPEQEYE